jgi:hypothetical protein
MADLEGVVGRNRTGVGDNTSDAIRLGKTGEVTIARALGQYAEAVSRGGVYIAEVGTAGVAPGTAISTTPPLTLWNPPNSGILCVIYKFIFTYVSGTLGAGEMLYLQNAQTALPSGGTKLTPVNAQIGNLKSSAATAHSGSTVAATPTLVMHTGVFFGAYAGGAGPLLPPIEDPLDGSIIVYPGNALSVQDNINNAGTSPKVNLGFAWEEVPIT